MMIIQIGTTPNRNRCFIIPTSSSHINHHNTDHNIDNHENYFYCMTCPYTCPVAAQQQQQQISKNHPTVKTTTIIPKKRMTIVTDLSNLNQYGKRRMMMMGAAANNNNMADLDILGGKSAWDNVDRTTIFCSKCCQQVLAYFVQIQIRSADEPMTIFYKCSTCQFQWNE
jgi:DNA-directed RNA polymerase subunit M/transcription elongation factor TFIIS